MAFELTDDGTMDTVLRCSECGAEERFNYDGEVNEERAEEVHAEYRRQRPNDSDSAIDDRVNETLYDEFIVGCIEQAESDHVCESDEDEPTEPEDGDITTEDHIRFYQYGRLVLERARKRYDSDLTDLWYYRQSNGAMASLEESDGTQFGDDSLAALRAYMDRVQFWPNCWVISDHGNAHLITF